MDDGIKGRTEDKWNTNIESLCIGEAVRQKTGPDNRTPSDSSDSIGRIRPHWAITLDPAVK